MKNVRGHYIVPKRYGWSNQMLQFGTTTNKIHPTHNDGNWTPDNAAVFKNYKGRKRNDSNIMRHIKKKSDKPIIIRIIVIMYLGEIESGPTTKQNPIQHSGDCRANEKGPSSTEI